MKKIYALVIALMATVAMYATQSELTKIDKAELTAKSKMETIRAQRIEKLADLSISTERHAIAPSPAASSASAASEGEVVTLNFTKLDDLKYQDDTQDWFLSMSCEFLDKPEFGYVVKLDYFAPEDDYCGTFNVSDFDHEYSYMFTPNNETVHYDDINMTVSKTQISTNKVKITLSATILGSNGVTYHINCVTERIEPAKKVETEIRNAVLTCNQNDFTFAGKNDVMDITMLVLSNRVIGNHSRSVDTSKSRFVYNGKSLSIMTVEVNIKAEEVDHMLSYVVDLNLVTKDTVLYAITMVSTIPTPVKTVDVVCDNLSVDEKLYKDFGYVYAEAKNDTYEILGMFPGPRMKEGRYTSNVEFYITNNETWNQVEALQYDLNLALDKDGKWTLTGTARCTDTVLYNLNLKWVAPVVEKVVKISYNTPATVYYTPEKSHQFEAMNNAGEWFAFVAVADVKPGERFGLDKVILDECFLLNNYTYDMPEIADVNGVIEQTNDTTKILVSFVCFNKVQYDIEMYYAVPTPTKTQTFTLAADYSNVIEDMGLFQFIAYTPDSTLAVSIVTYADQIEGTYGNDGMFGRLGAEGGLFTLKDDLTFVGIYNKEKQGYELNYVLKGLVTVTIDQNDNIIAEVDFICDNAVRYLLTLICPPKTTESGFEHDAQEGTVERTYTANDEVMLDSSVDEYGTIIYFSVIAEDSTDMMDVIFFADKADENIIIPVGKYTIDGSEKSGTVLANPGIRNGQLAPSFYAKLNQGGLETLYMLVKGSAEVSKNESGKLHVEINALNSNNLPVRIVYDDTTPAAAVENIKPEKSNVEKRIKDGQLYIIRNGKMFNVLGAGVK